jgi:hypothetical protein
LKQKNPAALIQTGQKWDQSFTKIYAIFISPPPNQQHVAGSTGFCGSASE